MYESQMFFDGDKVNLSKVVSELRNKPNETEKILEYVFEKVKHFTEFDVKKVLLKEKYDKKLHRLYAEYMMEE